MHSRRGLISAVALSAISVAFLWLTDIPLGIPGEWTWDRIAPADAGEEFVLGAAQAVIAGTVYILVVWLGSKRIATCSRVELAGWLFGIAGVGFGWLLAVQEAPPSGWRMSKAAFVVYYPGSSGYFHKARYEMPDSAEFLRGYEDLMAEGDVLHVGTHPPGLFLLYRTLIDELEQRPALAQVIENTAPASITEAFGVIDGNLMKTGKELTSSDRAVIWLVTMLTQACCVLAVIPIFLLIHQDCSRELSWRAAVFWPLLPALAIFIPKSDVLFVLPAALLTWTWLSAATRQSFFIGMLAGAIGWAGLCCSLAFLPIGLIALLASLLLSVKLPESDMHTDDSDVTLKDIARQMAMPASLWKPLLGGILAVVGLTIAVSHFCEMNLPKIWLHNYHNHAAFYAQFSRTMWKWWLVNPLELIFAAGVPVVFLAATSASRLFQSRGEALRQPLLVSLLAVWTLLWLSGKNSGEAARLWIPLLPVLLVASTCASLKAPDPTDTTSDDTANNDRGWLVLLSCQAVVCAATVLRVSGFHY
jgi:methylthioxylose transferase